MFYGQSVSLPSLPCHSPMDPWTKKPWWQRRRLCMVLTTWTASHQSWPGYSCYWKPDLPTAEINTEPQIWHHSSGWPASNLVAGWLHWTTSSMGRTILCPFWSRYSFLFMDLPLLYVILLPKLPSVDLECFIQCRGIPCSMSCNQRTHFTVREERQWP